MRSDNNTSLEENRIIFYEEFRSRIWIGNKEIDLIKMKNKENVEAYLDFFFDSVSKKIWAWNRQVDNKSFFVVDITNGVYVQDNEILFEIPENKQPVKIFAYNETAIVKYTLDNGLYGLIDLQSGKQEILDLRDIIGNFGINLYLIGWDGKSIVFNQGYINIHDKEYHNYTIELNYPYLKPDEHKVIGIDRINNVLVDYDFITDNYIKTAIKRNKLNLKDYCGIYIESECIYIAITSFWDNFRFLSGGPSKCDWYNYDIYTENRIKINAPSCTAKIIGHAQ
jgi:hypothetical protein